ncbi:hypothetical protein [Rhizomicrobium electricum]|jgi:hypothetical protein|uniref:DUF4156 domain-containing protein n=1 Tax=Rhizomicrobium electricum TaxID=480070 RepID=A0ABN1EC53_9PROT|nr:hypothetical protein [Rhizomicrobium electricum]NIJ48194.1 hypothetical protein [Rhizomicrobium electricum]
MKDVVKVAITALFALLATGCARGWLDDAPSPDLQDIRIISVGYTKACRFIAPVDVTSTYPQDQDLYLAAMMRVRAKATEMSGNALAIRSYKVQSGSKADTMATISADIYNCPPPAAG